MTKTITELMTKTITEDIAKAKYNQLLALKSFTLPTQLNGNFVTFVSNCKSVELLYSLQTGNIYWCSTSSFKSLNFEKVFELVSDDMKTELLFNLDLFR